MKNLSLLKEKSAKNIKKFIPTGATPIIQPVDISIGKPLKDKFRTYFNTWISAKKDKLVTMGVLKSPSNLVVMDWILNSYKNLYKEIMINSFIDAAICQNFDNSENNLINKKLFEKELIG
jgi:hypothetical protein